MAHAMQSCPLHSAALIQTVPLSPSPPVATQLAAAQAAASAVKTELAPLEGDQEEGVSDTAMGRAQAAISKVGLPRGAVQARVAPGHAPLCCCVQEC
jgi:hypothetical protein